MLTTNLDGCFQFQEHRLLHEDFTSGFAEHRDVFLFQGCFFASATVNELVYDPVKVKLAAHLILINYKYFHSPRLL